MEFSQASFLHPETVRVFFYAGGGRSEKNLPLFQIPQESRAGCDPPPQHHGRKRRKFLPDILNIFSSKKISVIAYRVTAVRKSPGKHLHAGPVPVKIFLYPGMDDQFFHIKLVINFQKVHELVRVFFPDPGLNGNFHVQSGKNLIEKAVQLLRKSQKSGSPPF